VKAELSKLKMILCLKQDQAEAVMGNGAMKMSVLIVGTDGRMVIPRAMITEKKEIPGRGKRALSIGEDHGARNMLQREEVRKIGGRDDDE